MCYGRKSTWSMCYRRKSTQTSTQATRSETLGTLFEMKSQYFVVIICQKIKSFSIFFKFFLALRFYDSGVLEKRGRQSWELGQSWAPMYLICGLCRRLFHQIYIHYFAWRLLIYVDCISDGSFSRKKKKNVNETGLSIKDIYLLVYSATSECLLWSPLQHLGLEQSP